MKRVRDLNVKIKHKILELLYEDELFNVFMIHFIENQNNDIGELYINEKNGIINEVLHLKYDGNSYFTNFYSKTNEGLKNIASQISSLSYERVLLAGKIRDISEIIKALNLKIEVTPNIYYKLDIREYNNQNKLINSSFKRATNSIDDIGKIKGFLIDFFEATTEDEIKDITDNKKILEDIEVGIYFIEYQNEIAGMARFSSITKNYADITTVYVVPKYRSKGIGKQLMQYMVEVAISKNKFPVTQTSELNIPARRTYESLNFIKQGDYAFEFIS